jgi:hypothetical protein
MAQYMAGHADPRTTKLYDRLVSRSPTARWSGSGMRRSTPYRIQTK